MDFVAKSFSELSTDELYDILMLRSKIFVVEQDCVYNDLDGMDKVPEALHVIGKEGDGIVAYARVLPPDTRFPETSIGRVVVHQKFRGKELGKGIMKAAIGVALERFGETSIRISAQKYLLKFYGELGFKVDSEEYLEDGIPHVEMLQESVEKTM